MKKILIFLLIMIFGMITKVSALNYDYSVGTQHFFMNDHINKSYVLQSQNTTNTTLADTITFDTPITTTNANFLRFAYSGAQLTSSILANNINFNLTCSNYSGVSSGTTGYTIYYQDGSTASISGTTRDIICTSYTSSTSTITLVNYDISNVAYQIYLRTTSASGQWQQCEMENGFIVCPVLNNVEYSGLTIYYRTLSSSYIGGTTYNFRIYRVANEIKTSTQTIIDNQNQNAQQQHQDAQNINNSITSDNISGNNSTTTINNLGGTFQTQQDFLLNLIKLPYTFFSALSNTIQNQCSPLTIGTIFDYNLVMPCVNLSNLLGDVWTLIIDVIFAGVIASAFVRRVTKYIREVCTLDTNALNTGGVKIW